VRSEAALLALDRATRAIAGELDLDRVLQLLADSVRELVGARYAALGIVGPGGRIEQFITSGITDEERARIGAPPRGRGVLGTIIRTGQSVRVDDIARHPDSYGFPSDHPVMRSFLGVPVPVAGVPVGNFYLTEKADGEPFTAGDQELVEMFAIHAGIAIENARLHRDVQQLAVVDERLRISRDLHDGIIQSIYAVSLSLEDATELISDDPAEATRRVDRAIDRLHTAIADIRTMIVGLGPAGEGGLGGVLDSMAHELFDGLNVDLDVDLSGADALQASISPEIAHEVIQIAREALTNVARHSGATRASLSLIVNDGAATLEVCDEGTGFDPDRRLGASHFGLANLRDRAAALAGSLAIRSGPGIGTRIILTLPLEHPEPNE